MLRISVYIRAIFSFKGIKTTFINLDGRGKKNNLEIVNIRLFLTSALTSPIRNDQGYAFRFWKHTTDKINESVIVVVFIFCFSTLKALLLILSFFLIVGSLRSKRYRHKFTKEQLNRLQQTFMQSMYLNSAERSQLADELNLTDIQLKMWFQNRRMRMRKSFKKTAAGQKQYSSSIIQAHQHQNNPFTLPRCRSVIPMPSSHCREDFNGYKSVQNLYHRPNISLQYAADQLQHRPSFHHPHKTRIVFPPRFSPYPRQPQYHQCNHIQYRPENRKQMSSIPKERSSNQPTKNSDAPVQRLQDGKIVVKKGVVDLTDKEHCETSINPRPVNTLIPASAQLDDRLVGLQNYVLSEGRYMFQPRRWQFVNKE